ncbi:RNA cap guanine-N2 methyltransferase-domain-containing protein [Geopyxis carbonaria]|nr:RNA cap guanine-N2 methyltransferase-domain-containing protein [Geopyxis carbonaria]
MKHQLGPECISQEVSNKRRKSFAPDNPKSSLNDQPSNHIESEVKPDSVNLYSESNPPPDHIWGYWKQRNRLFERYNQGVWMTDDSWFEMTPEAIASCIAQKFLENTEVSAAKTIVDAFCGVGGNSIQFALLPECKKVYAIDTNADAIACAKHNARIYNVQHKIEFIHGDFFQLCKGILQTQSIDGVFLSPPWGGPSYREDEVFNLETMQPYPASKIIRAARTLSENLALYIPRTSDLNQLGQHVVTDEPMIEVVHYALNNRSKAITAYFGQLSKHSK